MASVHSRILNLNRRWPAVFMALFLWCLGLLLIFSACQATPTPPTPIAPTDSPVPSQTATLHPIPTSRPTLAPSGTPVLSPTPGPSPTSTALPPLVAHTWQPAPVLVQAGYYDKDNLSPFGKEPYLVLYATGQLIMKQCQGARCTLGTQTLDRQGICSFLNTIDRQGFFDYDPSTFQSPQGGGRAFYLEVNAWRSKSVQIDGLDQWLQDPSWLDKQLHCTNCVARPVVLAALANTFDFLNRYHPTGLKTFQADRLAVWISQPWLAGTSTPWLLQGISLSQMYTDSRCSDPANGRAIELTGSEAVSVSEYVNQIVSLGNPPVFTEGNLKLQVVDQWLLPGEVAAGCGETTDTLPAVSYPTPDFQLQCQPSDGLIPIPTPTLPPPIPLPLP